MFVQKLSIAAILIAGLSLAAPQAAAKNFDISYKPSEVQTVEGRANVYKRIEETARELCAYQFVAPYANHAKNRMDRCMRRTVNGFIHDINHFKLTELHASKTQETPRHRDILLAQKPAK